MTREEAIEVLELIEEDIDCDGCRYFPDKEHCECVEECLYATALKVAIKTLEQEPKTGHWTDDTRLGYHVSICSNCDWRGHGDTCLIYKPRYCPNCGTRMESEDT